MVVMLAAADPQTWDISELMACGESAEILCTLRAPVFADMPVTQLHSTT
jgi:hypothetical protein